MVVTSGGQFWNQKVATIWVLMDWSIQDRGFFLPPFTGGGKNPQYFFFFLFFIRAVVFKRLNLTQQALCSCVRDLLGS